MAKKNLLEEMQQSINKVLERPVIGPEKARTSRAILEEFKSSSKGQDGLPDSSIPEIGRLPKDDVLDYQNSSLPISDSLLNNSTLAFNINLMTALPDVEGWSKLWHQIVDHLYRQLTLAEQAVHIQLFRLSWGFGQAKCVISHPVMAKRIGASKGTVQAAIDGLVEKGLIKKLQTIQGKSREQGIEYYVEPPPALLKSSSLLKNGSLPKSSTNKEKAFKRKDIKGNSPKITRLTPEDKQETIEMIAELITKSGYSFEQAEGQFGGNLTAEDWTAIRARVEGQEVKS